MVAHTLCVILCRCLGGLIWLGSWGLIAVGAQTLRPVETKILRLGETAVKVNLYQRAGLRLTFVGLHHDEGTGLEVVKELIAQQGGRLIELVSYQADGVTPARGVRFTLNGASFALDPNRIFTDSGRLCEAKKGKYPAAALPAVRTFADELLKIMLPRCPACLPERENFLVAVHNNSGVTEENAGSDLTAFGFVKEGRVPRPWLGGFQANIAGVYLANDEPNEDNFFLVSHPREFHQLAGGSFHVVLQQSAKFLINTTDCKVDDGSLSVYFGRQNLSYINIEAQRGNGRQRQAQMLEAVVKLVR